MKSNNLKRAVEKFAPVEVKLGKNDYYCSRLGNHIISWHVSWYEKEEQEASLVRVRHVNDKDEIQSDYMGGSFYDTIKSAIWAFSWDLHKGVTK